MYIKQMYNNIEEKHFCIAVTSKKKKKNVDLNYKLSDKKS